MLSLNDGSHSLLLEKIQALTNIIFNQYITQWEFIFGMYSISMDISVDVTSHC